MGSNLFRLDILGQSLTIRSNEDPAYICEVFEYLKQKLNEVQKEAHLTDPMKTSLLTALSLVDEVFQLRTRAAGQVQAGVEPGESVQIEEITRRMIARIERSLEGGASAGNAFPGGAEETPLPAGGIMEASEEPLAEELEGLEEPPGSRDW